MIKELVNFTKNLDEEFKNIGSSPKEGLHILIREKTESQISSIDTENFEYEIFSKKSKESPSDFLLKCKSLHQNAWCIDTNKCFDLPTKAIHTCSPFCIAFKREHLIGGAKYKENEGKKAQIYDRFDTYFEKAFVLFETDEEKEPYVIFRHFFTHNLFSGVLRSIEQKNAEIREKLNLKIEELKEAQKNTSDKAAKESFKEKVTDLEQQLIKVKELDDSDYILFYLDQPLEKYKQVHKKYLDDKLFNTDKYNTSPDEKNLIYGTSNFMNGFNGNMPFLMHQTASFDITGRISNIEAKLLNDFKNLLPNKTLPNPLPIFIYKEELQKEVIGIFRESGYKLGYKEIIEKLIENYSDDIRNYYLLFWQNTKDGIVFKDFDFVSKFEYKISGIALINYFEIKEKGGKESKHYPAIKNIFDLENLVFKQLIQNKYKRLDYFGDLNKEDYAKLDFTFTSYSKYRKTVYDFVYKSQRQAVQLDAFHEMVFNGIRDDIKQANEYGVKEKLNIWYSFHHMFNPNTKNNTMASNLKNYQDFVAQLAVGSADIDSATDEHFAFAAGQLIEYVIKKSKTEDRSYLLLEPYLQQARCTELKKTIANDIARYKHAINDNETRFKSVAAFVQTWETERNMKDLLPILLSGIFAKNQFFTIK